MALVYLMRATLDQMKDNRELVILEIKTLVYNVFKENKNDIQ